MGSFYISITTYHITFIIMYLYFKFKLYYFYNDYVTSYTTYINHARWHRCLRSDGLRVGGNRSAWLGDHMTISHADSGIKPGRSVRGVSFAHVSTFSHKTKFHIQGFTLGVNCINCWPNNSLCWQIQIQVMFMQRSAFNSPDKFVWKLFSFAWNILDLS